MACGSCKGGGNRHGRAVSDLKKMAYLTPRQLKYLESIQQGDIDTAEPKNDGDK